MNVNNFNPSELSSRKLFQLVNSSSADNRAAELEQAVRELTLRRRYMEQLASLGKLQGNIHNP